MRGPLAGPQTKDSNPDNLCAQELERGVPVHLFNDWECLCAAGFASLDGDGKEYGNPFT